MNNNISYVLLGFILGYIVSGIVCFFRINKQDKQINILNSSVLYLSNVFNQVATLTQQQISKDKQENNQENK